MYAGLYVRAEERPVRLRHLFAVGWTQRPDTLILLDGVAPEPSPVRRPVPRIPCRAKRHRALEVLKRRPELGRHPSGGRGDQYSSPARRKPRENLGASLNLGLTLPGRAAMPASTGLRATVWATSAAGLVSQNVSDGFQSFRNSDIERPPSATRSAPLPCAPFGAKAAQTFGAIRAWSCLQYSAADLDFMRPPTTAKTTNDRVQQIRHAELRAASERAPELLHQGPQRWPGQGPRLEVDGTWQLNPQWRLSADLTRNLVQTRNGLSVSNIPGFFARSRLGYESPDGLLGRWRRAALYRRRGERAQVSTTATTRWWTPMPIAYLEQRPTQSPEAWLGGKPVRPHYANQHETAVRPMCRTGAAPCMSTIKGLVVGPGLTPGAALGLAFGKQLRALRGPGAEGEIIDTLMGFRSPFGTPSARDLPSERALLRGGLEPVPTVPIWTGCATKPGDAIAQAHPQRPKVWDHRLGSRPARAGRGTRLASMAPAEAASALHRGRAGVPPMRTGHISPHIARQLFSVVGTCVPAAGALGCGKTLAANSSPADLLRKPPHGGLLTATRLSVSRNLGPVLTVYPEGAGIGSAMRARCCVWWNNTCKAASGRLDALRGATGEEADGRPATGIRWITSAISVATCAPWAACCAREARAEALIAEMDADLAKAARLSQGPNRCRCLNLDSEVNGLDSAGGRGFVSVCCAPPGHAMYLPSGIRNKLVSTANTLVAPRPRCDSSGRCPMVPAKRKRQLLHSDPVLSQLRAVRNGRLLDIPFTQLVPTPASGHVTYGWPNALRLCATEPIRRGGLRIFIRPSAAGREPLLAAEPADNGGHGHEAAIGVEGGDRHLAENDAEIQKSGRDPAGPQPHDVRHLVAGETLARQSRHEHPENHGNLRPQHRPKPTAQKVLPVEYGLAATRANHVRPASDRQVQKSEHADQARQTPHPVNHPVAEDRQQNQQSGEYQIRCGGADASRVARRLARPVPSRCRGRCTPGTSIHGATRHTELALTPAAGNHLRQPQARPLGSMQGHDRALATADQQPINDQNTSPPSTTAKAPVTTAVTCRLAPNHRVN
ncbi:hypothetical protein FQR65_LT20718 [Abscondita terminalis]|nr:hypothetical protein FQR65_LT20718 [Abscondita terminalis]